MADVGGVDELLQGGAGVVEKTEGRDVVVGSFMLGKGEEGVAGNLCVV